MAQLEHNNMLVQQMDATFYKSIKWNDYFPPLNLVNFYETYKVVVNKEIKELIEDKD